MSARVKWVVYNTIIAHPHGIIAWHCLEANRANLHQHPSRGMSGPQTMQVTAPASQPSSVSVGLVLDFPTPHGIRLSEVEVEVGEVLRGLKSIVQVVADTGFEASPSSTPLVTLHPSRCILPNSPPHRRCYQHTG